MELTKSGTLQDTHPVGENTSSSVALKPPALASGVIVKFQSQGKQITEGRNKIMRRDFYEHDNRKGKSPAGGKPKWTLSGPVNTAKKDMETSAGSGGGGGGAACVSLVGAQKQPEKMNSKARRAAKFREMKVLQRIMLSKEVNIAQLLPNLTPNSNSGCCHCKCSNQQQAGHCVPASSGNVMEVVKSSCTVR